MSPNPASSRWWRKALLAVLFVSVPGAGLAKTKSKGGDFDLTGIIRPDLVDAKNDPALRFPVMPSEGSVFGVSYGWLDISNSTIRYTAVQPKNKSERSFQLSRLGISDLRLDDGWVIFRSADKRESLTYMPQDLWGTVHTSIGMNSAAKRESLGSASIYKTLLNFDRVMALVNPAEAAPSGAQSVTSPGARPTAPASPPAIVLSSPAGAADSHLLDWQDSTVVIRGVAMDSSGIPVVRINGLAANMRPQTAQAVEFWSDPLNLQPGNNTIQIIAVNSAQLEATRVLTLNYTPKTAAANTKGLDKAEIISLLQGGVPAARITDLVRQRGIKFSPSAGNLKAIRTAGGTNELIQAIQQAVP
jgi:hypothetical protein